MASAPKLDVPEIGHKDSGCPLPVPSWVAAMMGSVGARLAQTPGGSRLEVRESEGLALVTVLVKDASALDAPTFQRRTTEAYLEIARVIKNLGASHANRFWNFIPDIRTCTPAGLDRYMIFNAGRFTAFTESYGNHETFERTIATATGIGHSGRDLVIHALAAGRPGLHVDNPRQRRPHTYSRRYGPLPPCFARATVLRAARGGPRRPLILVGGTASVRGEETVHVDQLAAQTEETLRNLSALIEQAHLAVRKDQAAQVNGRGETDSDSKDLSEPLRTFREVRVYYRDARHEDTVRRLVLDSPLGQRRVGSQQTANVEFFQADICRPELLVEIEGVADLIGTEAPAGSAGSPRTAGAGRGA